jgi:LPS export ABC transporter permease LptG
MTATARLLRFLPAALLAAAAAALASWLVPREWRIVQEHLSGFPDADTRAHSLRPLILGALCFIPALAALAHAFGSCLDRYVTRRFAGIFAISFSALLLIWLLIDFNDKLGDFRASQNIGQTIASYYLTRLPSILLLLLPYALLLSLLQSLNKLSRDREIVAMIQSGRSISRICRPLVLAGLWCVLFCAGLNYHWAPTAEGLRDDILDEARGLEAAEARNVLYQSENRRRLWLVGAFPRDFQKGAPLLDVEVTTSDANQRIRSRLMAKQARWDPEERTWSFENAVIGRYEAGRPPKFENPPEAVLRRTWTETPMQIVKPGLSPPYLGIPDLGGWLRNRPENNPSAPAAPYLTQWHYRWALPFTCLVTVLLAAPLSIHFSRRPPGSGIFLAVVLSALMMLVSSVTLSLGESALLPPMLAAWSSNLLFALLGIYLFKRRSAGQPIYRLLFRRAASTTR